jgi:hypothetical protein
MAILTVSPGQTRTVSFHPRSVAVLPLVEDGRKTSRSAGEKQAVQGGDPHRTLTALCSPYSQSITPSDTYVASHQDADTEAGVGRSLAPGRSPEVRPS